MMDNGRGKAYMIGGVEQSSGTAIFYYVVLAMAIVITGYDVGVWGTLIAEPGTAKDRSLSISDESLWIISLVGAAWSLLGWVLYAIVTIMLKPTTQGPNRLWNFGFLWSGNFLVHLTAFVCFVTIYAADGSAKPLDSPLTENDLVSLVLAIAYLFSLTFMAAWGVHGVYALFYAAKFPRNDPGSRDVRAAQRKWTTSNRGSYRQMIAQR